MCTVSASSASATRPLFFQGQHNLTILFFRFHLSFSKQDCRAALRLDPTVIGGVTLLGYACLRLGIHGEASRFLSEGLALALSQPGVYLRTGAELGKKFRYCYVLIYMYVYNISHPRGVVAPGRRLLTPFRRGRSQVMKNTVQTSNARTQCNEPACLPKQRWAGIRTGGNGYSPLALRLPPPP